MRASSRSAARSVTGAARASRGRSPTRTSSRRPDPAPVGSPSMATATFDSLNPATGEVIEQFPRSTADDVDRAVRTARAAWDDWRLVPAPERGNILFRFAQLLEREKPALSDLMTREMGKVKA